MKKIRTTILLFIISTSIILSQEGYVDGYSVTNTFDTIKAKINFKISGSKVKIIEENGEKKTFKPSQIKGFGKLGIEIYRSVSYGRIFNDKPDMFAKLIESGYLTLYNAQLENDNEIKSSYYCFQTKSDSTKLNPLYPPLFFKKTMKYFIGDDEVTYSKVANAIYGYNELPLILKEYNERKKTPDTTFSESNTFVEGNNINTKENYNWGYYVTLNNDTVDCEIYDKDFIFSSLFVNGPLPTKISVHEKNGDVKKFKADEIKAYGKRNLHTFRSIRIPQENNKKIFAKVGEDGPLILYYYSIHIRKGDKDITEEYFYIQKKDDETLENITNRNFEETLIPFISDNQLLAKQLKENQFKFEDLKLIIKKYNSDKLKH